MFVALWIGGSPLNGLGSLGSMAAIGALVLLAVAARRSVACAATDATNASVLSTYTPLDWRPLSDRRDSRRASGRARAGP
jgi:hypothetical protein